MDEPVPVACTLTSKDAASQLLEWHDLTPRARTISELEDGVVMTFSSDLDEAVRDLADREARCCAFLDIVTSVNGDELTLRITTQSPDGVGVIRLLAGLAA